MARTKGTLQISSNIEANFSAPLDARMKVKTLADLTDPNSFPYSYVGLWCYVEDAQKWYTLRYEDPTNISSWVEGTTGADGKNGMDCAIDSITKQGRENTITFVWRDPDGSDKFIDMVVLDGAVGDIGPVGPQGEKGEDGRSFTISSMYDSEEALREAHPTGEEGDAYLVGNETDTPDFWFWDTLINDWHNAGALAGAKGDKGDKGDRGDSPTFTVVENGPNVYKLRITVGETSFVTPNLKGIDGNLAPQAVLDNSVNPVQSGTIKTAIDTKQNSTLSNSMTIGETTVSSVEEALTALNEKTVDVDTTTDITSNNPISNKATTTALNAKQNKELSSPIIIDDDPVTNVEDALVALNNKTVDVDSEIKSDSVNPVQNKVIKTELNKKVDKTKLGAVNGVAELDSQGKVPASQLPSFVDDVKECYYDPDTEKMYENKDSTDPENPVYSDEITPEAGKIYIDKDGNDSYRWTGSMYASVGSANALTLGETAQTAYRGDRGKIAYEDSQTNKANIGTVSNLSTTDKTDLVSAINEVKAEVGGKVDKVTGKGLSTNDYDNTAKAEVAKVTNKQDKNLSKSVIVDGENKSTVEDVITALATLSNFNAGSKLNALAIADVFDEEAEYEIDDYVIHDTKLYKTISAHTGEWNSSDFEEKQVMDEIIAAAVSDYDSLQNKPQIAGITLSGNKTYSELGIQQSETGKGLSTNDYTNAAKEIVDGVTTALAAKQPSTLATPKTIEGANVTTVQGLADATASHTSKNVTDTSGVHGFKVSPINEDEDAIYYKSGNDWKQIQLGSVTQLEEIPTPAAKYVGKIYQYVGTTTQEYKKGYFYECINAAGSYSWQAVRVQSGGGQTIQYDPLPTAEASLYGSLLQYVGVTNTNYKRGHFYECVSGDVADTFVWKEVSVETTTLSDQDIEDIKAAFDAGLSPEEEEPVTP